MYIFVFEDGTFHKSKEVLEDDIRALKDGIVEIINAETCQQMVGEDKWEDLSEWRDIEG